MFNLIGLICALRGNFVGSAAFFAYDFLEDRKKQKTISETPVKKFVPLTKEQHLYLEYKHRRDLDPNLYGPF